MQNIESRTESIAYWNLKAIEAAEEGNAAAAITFRNMAWILEHPEGWAKFIEREAALAILNNGKVD